MSNIVNFVEARKSIATSLADFGIKLNQPLNLRPVPEPPSPVSVQHAASPEDLSTIQSKMRCAKNRVFSLTIDPVRDYVARKQVSRLLGKLFKLAMKLNRPDFHVHVKVSGNKDRVQVEVYPGGWSKDASGKKLLDCYIARHRKDGRVKPDQIREALCLLKQYSVFNGAGVPVRPEHRRT